MNTKIHVIFTLFIIFIFTPVSLLCENKKPILFPNLYKTKPNISSPYIFTTPGHPVYNEYITIMMPDEKGYAVIPVTQENGEIYSCMHLLRGKGKQCSINSGDFPSLLKTGIHDNSQLQGKKYITGREIGLINYIARPGGFSRNGFIGENEDIISVLKRDNRVVKMLGMKHSDLAKPLFHIWNAILGKYFGPHSVKNAQIFYNSHVIYINAESGKGHQESIFHDEIEGRWNIQISRKFKQEEVDLLKKSYPEPTPEKILKLQTKLTSIRISEMNPYYIMRYGFYEGNTAYRADPVAISLIFGLRTLEEILDSLGKDLYKVVCSDNSFSS